MGVPKEEGRGAPTTRRRAQAAKKATPRAKKSSGQDKGASTSPGNSCSVNLDSAVKSTDTNTLSPTDQDGGQSDVTQPPESSVNTTPSTEPKGRGRRPRKNLSKTPTTNESASIPATPKAVNKRKVYPQHTSTPLAKVARGVSPPATPDILSSPENVELTLGGRPRRRAAKVALEYLHNITGTLNENDADPLSKDGDENENDSNNANATNGTIVSKPRTPAPKKQTPGRGKKKKKKKFAEADSDGAEDSDFVPEEKAADDESEESAELEDDEDDDVFDELTRRVRKSANLSLLQRSTNKVGRPPIGYASNGLVNRLMCPVWQTFQVHKDFRDANLLPWVFPEWIPTSRDWQQLSSRYEPNPALDLLLFA